MENIFAFVRHPPIVIERLMQIQTVVCFTCIVGPCFPSLDRPDADYPCFASRAMPGILLSITHIFLEIITTQIPRSYLKYASTIHRYFRYRCCPT